MESLIEFFSTNALPILLALFAVSEILGTFDVFKNSSIFKLVKSLLSDAITKAKGEKEADKEEVEAQEDVK